MLVSQRESITKPSQWEKLEQFDKNAIISKEQLSTSKTGLWNEYEKFSNVFLNEYAKQVEIFLKFHKSSIDVFFNCMGVWKNFHCCFEQNNRLHEYYLLKNK